MNEFGNPNSPPKLGGAAARINVSQNCARRRGGSNDAKPPYGFPRSAPYQSVRCAIIYKVASRLLEPPRPLAIRWLRILFLDLASTPPNLGGEFESGIIPISSIRVFSRTRSGVLKV